MKKRIDCSVHAVAPITAGSTLDNSIVTEWYAPSDVPVNTQENPNYTETIRFSLLKNITGQTQTHT